MSIGRALEVILDLAPWMNDLLVFTREHRTAPGDILDNEYQVEALSLIPAHRELRWTAMAIPI